MVLCFIPEINPRYVQKCNFTCSKNSKYLLRKTKTRDTKDVTNAEKKSSLRYRESKTLKIEQAILIQQCFAF